MLSMSFGFRSASRFTTWSWLEVVEPPERVMEVRPDAKDAFEMMTPSTTYNGSPCPRIEVAPRIWICMPPPVRVL